MPRMKREGLDRRQVIVGSIAAATSISLPFITKASAMDMTMPSATVSPIVMMDALRLSTEIKNRTISCREVMSVYLQHIDRYNPTANAIVSRVDSERLLATAAESDDLIAKGNYKGWMHGLPHAVKDLAFTKGIRTTLGSLLFESFVPPIDAIFVERLHSAGAIIIGKTNTPELGLGSQTYNPIFGTTKNAYDPTKTAGGSSGGAAASLALRLVPVADGSDFAGSLRNPAGWNNIFGFRPSSGRVPYGPTSEIFMQEIGYEGPMGRTVTDVAMLLSTMAGYDDRIPLSLTGDPKQFAEPLKRELKGTKIAWLGDLGGIPMEPGMLEFCLNGLRRIEAAGCVIEEAKLGVGRDVIWNSFVKLRQGFLAGGLLSYYKDPAKRDKFKPEALWEIENGIKLSAADLYAASVQRSSVFQAYHKLFQTYDFVAMPSAQVFPFDANVHWPHEVAGVQMDSYHRWMEIVAGPSLAGCPTICVPAGFNAAGVPTGIQIMGRSQQDLAVLQVAWAFEQVSQSVLARLPQALTA